MPLVVRKFNEPMYFLLALLLLLFLNTVFDPQLALYYFLIVTADAIWYAFDKLIISRSEPQFPIEKTTNNRLTIFIETIIFFAGFLIISTFLSKLTIQGMFQAQFNSQIAFLTGETIIKFLTLGIFIPIFETSFFFGRMLEVLKEFINKNFGSVNFTQPNIYLLIVVFMTAGVFSLFHIVAYQTTQLLMVTFIFGVTSAVMVIKQKELKGAILLHILNNSIVAWRLLL